MDPSRYSTLHTHVEQEPDAHATADSEGAGPLNLLYPFGTEIPFLGLDFGLFPSPCGGDFALPFNTHENTSCDDGMLPALDLEQLIDFNLMRSPTLSTTPSSIVEEPSSPELSMSSQTFSPVLPLTLELDEAPTPPPSVDYTSLVAHIDSDLFDPFYEIIQDIGNGNMPSKEALQKFVPAANGRYFCAFNDCPWHETGWKREDRGIQHVRKVHFQLVEYRCHCGGEFQWSHDLKKHRRNKHRQAGEPEPAKYVCSESGCTSTFDKKYNLERHRAKVHKKGSGSRRAAARK